jgi:hypothetical protein
MNRQELQADSWLLAHHPITWDEPLSVAEIIHREISEYLRKHKVLPATIKANPCTIIELPGDRWLHFPFLLGKRIIQIPIISDCTLPIGAIAAKTPC